MVCRDSTAARKGPQKRYVGVLLATIALLPVFRAAEAEWKRGEWHELPLAGWEAPRREVKGLKGQHLVALGYPAKDDGELTFAGEEAYPAGLYRLRLVLRPSHTANAIAFRGGLRVECGHGQVTTLSGIQFTRVHEPETKTVTFVHRKAGPLLLALAAQIDPEDCEKTFTAAKGRRTVTQR